MTKDYPTDRRTAVRLTLEEKWAIAEYCIEHRNVINHDGEILFRVQQTQTSKEINQQKVVSREIGAHHIADAIDIYSRICKLTKNMPFQTPQDTVEVDRLTAIVNRKEELIVRQNKTINDLREYIIKVQSKVKEVYSALATTP